jgi:hypothetical protein
MRAGCLLLTMAIASFTFAQLHGPDSLWIRTFQQQVWFDPSGLNGEAPCFITETADGGIVMAGSCYSGVHPACGFIRKLDGRGRVLWLRVLRDYRIVCGAQTMDGGFVFGNGGGAFRTDANGNVLWESGGLLWAVECNAVRQASDGGFLLAGWSSRYGGEVVRLTSQGEMAWYCNTGNTNLYDVCEVAKGEVVAVGKIGRLHPEHYNPPAAVIARIDTGGNLLWEKLWIDSSVTLIGRAVFPLEKGGFTVACERYIDTRHPLRLMKCDENGDTLWTHDVACPFVESSSQLVRTQDGEFILAGTISPTPAATSAALFSLDSTGKVKWFCDVGDGPYIYEGFTCCETCDGGYLLTGTALYDEYDSFISRYRSNGPVQPCGSRPLLKLLELDPNYPNPFNAVTHLTIWTMLGGKTRLRLYDELGRLVTEIYNGYLPAGTSQVNYNAASLPSGSYFCRVELEGAAQTRRIVVLK